MVGIDQVASVPSSADVAQPCRRHHAVAKHLKTESADSGDHISSVIVHPRVGTHELAARMAALPQNKTR